MLVRLAVHQFSAHEIDDDKTDRTADQPAVKSRARIFVDDEFPARGNVVDRLKEHGGKISQDDRHDGADQDEILKFCRHFALVAEHADEQKRDDRTD